MAMALFVWLISGCGQSHKNRGIIEDFMQTRMNLEDYDVLSWSEPQTTYFVSDSMLQAMRRRAQASRLVRGNVPYKAKTDRLVFMEVRYVTGQDTIRQTFYLDDKNTGVVGFKTN